MLRMHYLIATLIALPVGILLWGQLLYFIFGMTGEQPSATGEALSGGLALALSYTLCVYRCPNIASVLLRGRVIGVAASLMLPVTAVVVLLIWQQAEDRRDLGMGGLMLYNLPIAGLIAGLLLSAVFWGFGRLGEHMERRK